MTDRRPHRERLHRDDEPDSFGEMLDSERLRSLVANEPGLWPVVVVLSVVAVTFGAVLLTLAIRGRSVLAAAVVAILFLMSVMLVDGSRRKHGRVGPALWIVVGFWSASVAATGAILWWSGG